MGKGGPGKRAVGSNRKHKKFAKTHVRKEFELRHIDQVWEDVRKAPAEVLDSKSGPMGTTAR